jgi:Tfp pilus assembly protein PilF/2-polyprenyl-3-methyl-5-hydroxy-6-metoxy-1,4-benzoquinol methylase
MTFMRATLNNDPGDNSKNSAIALIDEGNVLEEEGRTAEAMARYDAAVRADPSCARAHSNRGNVLFAAGQIDEARRAYQQAIACDSQYAGAHFNLGNLHCRVGQYESALHSYQAAVGIRTDWADAFVAIGNVLQNIGRTSEAMESYERALAINPDHAEVHVNVGLLAAAAGRYEAAASSFRRAIELRPDYAPAHYVLGKLLADIGHLDAAETSLRCALSLQPEAESVVSDLASVLQLRGKAAEGVALTLQYLERLPTATIRSAFVNCVARTSFTAGDSPLLRKALISAINGGWAAPHEICQPALSLVMLDPVIAGCVRLVNNRWPARIRKAELFCSEGLARLAADDLLKALLEAVPICTVEFERLLTVARQALLETVMSAEPPDPVDRSALRFYSALARQCFINEYILDCDEHEQAEADACRTRLVTLLDSDAAVPPLLLLVVAAYYPLHVLPNPSRLLAREQPAPIENILRQQVREPLEEQALRAGVKPLTSITSGVSEQVRDQYEQNPYPRWAKIRLLNTSLPFNYWLRQRCRTPFTPMADDSQPEILIAGCGTGSQAISTSDAIRGARVLAVDLSLSSLTYALRKTQELGISNIEYAQADILKLGDIKRTFDIVVAAGVLHHLAEPYTGWRILLSRLRPGGFMYLGFYSQLARRHVTTAREFIAARGYASTPDDIRRFRRDISGPGMEAELAWLNAIPDFYSTSMCRDLLFHVQEHCLTLDAIGSFLSDCGLQFVGFDLEHTLLQQYHTRFVDDRTGTDLRNWARFEADNPDTFVGMYRFWVQKTINH